MKQDRKAEMACTHYTPRITSSDKPLHVALALKGCSTRQRQRRTAPPDTGIEGLLRWASIGSDGLLHLAPALRGNGGRDGDRNGGRDGMLCGVLSATDC